MRGRYTLKVRPEEIAGHFDLDEVPLFEPRYTIAPTQALSHHGGWLRFRIGTSCLISTVGAHYNSSMPGAFSQHTPKVAHMEMSPFSSAEEEVVIEVTQNQLEHFTSTDPRCRALQLPEGVLLRYTLSQALYFYLKTGVIDGRIKTVIYSSDSPYDRQKARIGEVSTAMFEARADFTHLEKVERLLRGWVDFVQEESDAASDFKSFELGDRNGGS
jgi:hypothetical protein